MKTNQQRSQRRKNQFVVKAISKRQTSALQTSEII